MLQFLKAHVPAEARLAAEGGDHNSANGASSPAQLGSGCGQQLPGGVHGQAPPPLTAAHVAEYEDRFGRLMAIVRPLLGKAGGVARPAI